MPQRECKSCKNRSDGWDELQTKCIAWMRFKETVSGRLATSQACMIMVGFLTVHVKGFMGIPLIYAWACQNVAVTGLVHLEDMCHLMNTCMVT